MNKKQWQEHSKWLDSFRGKTITNDSIYEEKKIKKQKKKPQLKKKISGYYFDGVKLITLYEKRT